MGLSLRSATWGAQGTGGEIMKPFSNVVEPYELHDTIVVCSQLYSGEPNAGYFQTFAQFGQQDRHLMFKRRSSGIVHPAYNNQDSEDRVDFPYHVFSMGLAFFAPPTPFDVESMGPGVTQESLPSFWTQQLPRHVSASLKIGQDIKVEAQGQMYNAGYGVDADGVALGIDDMFPGTGYNPEMVWVSSQGTPTHSARKACFIGPNKKPVPIAIPKGEAIEVEISLSEQAQQWLTQVGGPSNLITDHTYPEVPTYEFFPSRYHIQVSLWGYREVQQRGQLHAAGYHGKGA